MHLDKFRNHFHAVEDKRQKSKVSYCLFDILFGALCAVIANSNNWEEIREYVLMRHDWFKSNGVFLNKVPSESTFFRVISRIDPQALHQCFVDWMSSVHTVTEGKVVAIDGKTLRGTHGRDDKTRALHMVSAYASDAKLILGQVKTSEKSNEITAIPELVKLLDLKGALVTIDAMGCQTEIAQTIIDRGGNYLLAVKGNQEALHEAIQRAFAVQREEFNKNIKFEHGHGRIESRQCYVLDSENLDGDFSRWSELKSIVMAENFRFDKKSKKSSLEYRYFISSKKLTSEQAVRAVREHWGIETMHWILDVSMDEDACQIYKGYGAENLNCLRHIALNMVRAEPTEKVSLIGKRRRCMMNTSMLEAVLKAGLNSQLVST